MSKRLAIDLLAKVSNPSHSFADAEVDDEGSVANVPQRIASKHTRSRNRSYVSTESLCEFYF